MITAFHHPTFEAAGIQVDIKRLDLMHPHAQGNKFYKLKYNLEKARSLQKDTLLTFGGPWSNHLHATALAGAEHGFKTIGIVRGEEPKYNCPALKDAKENGMKLVYISRSEYTERNEQFFKAWLRDTYGSFYLIPEGGSNFLGLQGAGEIITSADRQMYDLLATPVGTGATLAGMALNFDKSIWGFPAVKDIESVQSSIESHLYSSLFDDSLVQETMAKIQLIEGFSFGGFAKHHQELVDFITEIKTSHEIEFDHVYTAKMMLGLIAKAKEIKPRTKVLAIHTGGLQGNRSLKFNAGG